MYNPFTWNGSIGWMIVCFNPNSTYINRVKQVDLSTTRTRLVLALTCLISVVSVFGRWVVYEIVTPTLAHKIWHYGSNGFKPLSLLGATLTTKSTIDALA